MGRLASKTSRDEYYASLLASMQNNNGLKPAVKSRAKLAEPSADAIYNAYPNQRPGFYRYVERNSIPTYNCPRPNNYQPPAEKTRLSPPHNYFTLATNTQNQLENDTPKLVHFDSITGGTLSIDRRYK